MRAGPTRRLTNTYCLQRSGVAGDEYTTIRGAGGENLFSKSHFDEQKVRSRRGIGPVDSSPNRDDGVWGKTWWRLLQLALPSEDAPSEDRRTHRTAGYGP